MSKKESPQSQERTLVQEMRTPLLIFGGAIVIALLVLAFGTNLTGGGTASAATPQDHISAKLLGKFQSKYDKLGRSIGPADAQVVVREFADYQCPACGAFEPAAEKIRKQLAAKGKIRYVFFDFPLPMHAHAHQAAVAAHCAARQGGKAFWTYHDKLYATQRRWGESQHATGDFLDLAVETGLRLKPFKQCLTTDATSDEVDASQAVGRKIQIRATPTILVGRRKFTGVQTYDTIVAEIKNQKAAAANANKGS